MCERIFLVHMMMMMSEHLINIQRKNYATTSNIIHTHNTLLAVLVRVFVGRGAAQQTVSVRCRATRRSELRFCLRILYIGTSAEVQIVQKNVFSICCLPLAITRRKEQTAYKSKLHSLLGKRHAHERSSRIH